MGQALYRRYRSRALNELVGQGHITSLLERALSKGDIAHAYLFTGPKGVGKTSVARIIAHAVNDLPYDGTQHLDIIEIDAASNRRIDDIRDLRDKVHTAPTSAKYKVYIIDEVHMLTSESFNALLKTLEEPPAHVIFILATTELHKVPGTIVSRTQRFSFRPVPLQEVADYLRTIADKENISISDDALLLIAEHGEGSFRDSISLLDQASSLSDGEIAQADIEGLLGLAPESSIRTLLDSIVAHKSSEAIEVLKGMTASGSSPTIIASQLARLIGRDEKSSITAFQLLDDLLLVSKSTHPSLKLLAIIARHSFAAKPAKTAHLTVEPLAVIEKPLPQRASRSTAKESTAPPEPDEPVGNRDDAPVAAAVKLSGEFDWEAVLVAVLARNAALHSVLKRAAYRRDDAGIHLEFAYSLHMKKLENVKYRSQLSGIITALYGDCPELIIGIKDKLAAIEDPASKDVAAIMGGGEPVNVPQA